MHNGLRDLRQQTEGHEITIGWGPRYESSDGKDNKRANCNEKRRNILHDGTTASPTIEHTGVISYETSMVNGPAGMGRYSAVRGPS